MATSGMADELAGQIGAALEPTREIRLAYVFGSRVRGNARPDSDLDVALSFGAELPSPPRGELILDAVAALTGMLGPLGERSDVLDFEQASSTVAFQVIRDGRCVLCRDPRDRVRLEARIARRYDDERPYRELFRSAAPRASERMGGVGSVSPDLIARRLLVLSDTLSQLEERLPSMTAEQLAADALLQTAVERWLQIAIESCTIDDLMANRLIPAPGRAPVTLVDMERAIASDIDLCS
jgi:predicted nucleotidyltransferase